jgi:hypothetical protein
VTLPGEVQETSEYDLFSDFVQTINATGMVSEYQYDDPNRLQSLTEG